MRNISTAVVTNKSLKEFFFGRVHEAVETLDFRAKDETIHYLINLLTLFGRTDHYLDSEKANIDRPLALILVELNSSASKSERNNILRQLGDIALFVSGFFSDSLNRKTVDVDYYVAMGGSAYSSLSSGLRGTQNAPALGVIFDELSEKFVACVDLLSEVSAGANIHNDGDILRTYELWLRTGSKRAENNLRASGIEPNRNTEILFSQ
jgi:hypothetical protein